MKIRSRYLVATLVLLGVAFSSHARPMDVQTDAFGNVVRDLEGARYTYDAGASSAARAQLNTDGTVGKVVALDANPYATVRPIAKQTAKSLTGTTALTANTLPDIFTEKWRTSMWGRSIGGSNLLVSDLNTDGQLEIIAGATGTTFGPDMYWYVAAYQPSSTQYTQIWSSPTYPASIARIITDDLDGKGKKIFVATTDGKLYVYDAWPVKLLGSYAIAAGATGMVAGDLDGDGTKELVITTSAILAVLSGTSFTELWSHAAAGGSDVAVGQLDADAALEIAVATTPGLVIDGVTHQIQWSYTSGFGVNVEIANIDNDAEAELVVAESWYTITAFDVVNKTPLWNINMSLDIGAMRLIDVDGDGIAEVVTGDGQWGSVRIFRASDRTAITTIGNPEHGVTDVNVADVDGDGKKEVLWGAGHTSTGKDILAVANIETQTIAWQSVDLSGPLSAVAIGDVDADGNTEIVVATYESASGYDSGVILVFDEKTHELEWQSAPIVGDYAWTGLHNLRLAQLDGDPQLEIVVAADHLYDGIIEIYDGLNHTLQTATKYGDYSGAPMYGVDIADADGDGTLDIVAGTGREHTGATSVNVFMFNPATGAETWRSVNLNASWEDVYDVHVADVDGDKKPEILASVNSGSVYVFDGGAKNQEWLSEDIDALALNAMDTDGDGVMEILVGTSGGELRGYSGQDHMLKWTLALGGAVTMIQPVTTPNGQPAVLAAAGTTLWAISPATHKAWGSLSGFTSSLGLWNHVAAQDVDADGNLDVVIGDANSAYEYAMTLYAEVDLQLSVVPKASAVTLGQPIVYDVSVANVSPNIANNVMVTVNLPGGVTGVSTSLGAECAIASSVITCNLSGSIVDTPRVFTLQLTPQSAGAVTVDASVAAAETDLQPLDNAVSVTVHANNLPQAQNTNLTVNEDVIYNGTLGATDVDSDPLSFFIVQSGARGNARIVNAATGAFSYTPNPDMNGDDTFTFAAQDGYGTSVAATVTVHITPVNDAPTLPDVGVSTKEDVAYSGQLMAFDLEGDPLTYSVVQDPQHGAVSIEQATGKYVYTPAADFHGTDTFGARVSDDSGAPKDAKITIVVVAVNDAPITTDDGVVTTVGAAVTIDVLANDSDVDGDALDLLGWTSPVYGTLVLGGDGKFTYTPKAGFNGGDTFKYVIGDGEFMTEARVTVTVGGTAQPGDSGSTNQPQSNDTSSTDSTDGGIVTGDGSGGGGGGVAAPFELCVLALLLLCSGWCHRAFAARSGR